MSQEPQPRDHAILTLPKDGTKAAQRYFLATSSDFGLFHFIIDIVLKGDYMAFAAKEALEGRYDYKKVDPSKLATTEPGPRTKFLRKNSQAFLEMFLGRLVDNFQTYLVDLVRIVLHAKPAMLSTRQQTLTLEELLKYERIEDLVHDIIERRVNALTYEGFLELQSWCAERGLEVQALQADGDAVVELIATRNVIAHNRGLVDEKYMRTAPKVRFKLGEVRELEVDDLFDAMALLNRVVAETDRLAAEKFQLSTVPLNLEAKTSTRIATDDDLAIKDNAANRSN